MTIKDYTERYGLKVEGSITRDLLESKVIRVEETEEGVNLYTQPGWYQPCVFIDEQA